MAFRVFDSRTDIQNLIVHPDIRARFLQMEPGEENVPHTPRPGRRDFPDPRRPGRIHNRRPHRSPGPRPALLRRPRRSPRRPLRRRLDDDDVSLGHAPHRPHAHLVGRKRREASAALRRINDFRARGNGRGIPAASHRRPGRRPCGCRRRSGPGGTSRRQGPAHRRRGLGAGSGPRRSGGSRSGRRRHVGRPL